MVNAPLRDSFILKMLENRWCTTVISVAGDIDIRREHAIRRLYALSWVSIGPRHGGTTDHAMIRISSGAASDGCRTTFEGISDGNSGSFIG